VLSLGAVFAIFAAWYYWFPKMTGYMYSPLIARTHFWVTFVGVNLVFFPQHFLGLAGMPRRIPDYATQFTDWNMVSSIGGWVYGVSQLLFVYVIWKCIHAEEPAPARPWEGARGLEWELSSPPPYHSWEEPPNAEVVSRAAEH
jgi:cytochrome c oxidase subunit 1